MLDQTKIEPRKILAQAITDRDVAVIDYREANAAAEYAKSVMTIAQAHLLSFKDLESRITAYRAQRIREWSSGGVDSDKPSMRLPKDLEDKIGERDLAEADATSAKAVHRRLAEDAEVRAETVRRLEGEVRAAADVVLSETAEAVADELGVAQSLVDALRFRLQGFMEIGPALRLSARARELSHYPREPFLIPNSNPKHSEFLNLVAYRRRLLTDPNSTLDHL